MQAHFADSNEPRTTITGDTNTRRGLAMNKKIKIPITATECQTKRCMAGRLWWHPHTHTHSLSLCEVHFQIYTNTIISPCIIQKE